MTCLHPSSPRSLPTRPFTLALAALILTAPVTWAGPAFRADQRYIERPPEAPPPAVVTHAPVKYTIHIYIDTKAAARAADTAQLVAHLPEDASLWVQDVPTRQRGTMRRFESPPLKPGHRYTYSARLVWFEEGKWVSQTLEVPVWAGKTTCLALGKSAAVTTALDELDLPDRKLAAEQKFCAVQPENRLGALGKPVKLMVKGQPVLLCCEACRKQAESAPEQTLAKARELRAKNAPPAAKAKEVDRGKP
jgi:uncharacterized protein (TIGR03000 family)